MTGNDGQWLVVADAAAVLGISARTVRRWAALGKLPVRRDVRPYLVDVAGQVRPGGRQATDTADMSSQMDTELQGLRAEIARKDERIRELTAERDYLRLLAGTLATGQQKAIEASRPVRRWRWPWQKERGP